MSIRKSVAEALGTFLFMMIGYTSIAAIAGTQPPITGLLVVPFSFGLGLLAAIAVFGHISGAHFNPAVTIAMVLDKRTTSIDGVGYIVAQVVGAVVAALVIAVTIDQSVLTSGITKPGNGVSDFAALILEIVFTAIFLLVILTSSKRSPSTAWIVIPLTLVAIHFAVATVSGASVNPARSIGSALVGGDLSALWIYIIGPVIGGAIGWGIFHALDEDEAVEV